MNKDFDRDFGSQPLGDMQHSAPQQVQLQIDDSTAHTSYSTLVVANATPEELILNFAGPLRPTGPKTAVMKVEQRVIMSPWAAKRFAIMLMQTLQRHEETYGPIEVDERKRRLQPPPTSGKPN